MMLIISVRYLLNLYHAPMPQSLGLRVRGDSQHILGIGANYVRAQSSCCCSRKTARDAPPFRIGEPSL